MQKKCWKIEPHLNASHNNTRIDLDKQEMQLKTVQIDFAIHWAKTKPAQSNERSWKNDRMNECLWKAYDLMHFPSSGASCTLNSSIHIVTPCNTTSKCHCYVCIRLHRIGKKIIRKYVFISWLIQILCWKSISRAINTHVAVTCSGYKWQPNQIT